MWHSTSTQMAINDPDADTFTVSARCGTCSKVVDVERFSFVPADPEAWAAAHAAVVAAMHGHPVTTTWSAEASPTALPARPPVVRRWSPRAEGAL